jgi:hypothetical protein
VGIKYKVNSRFFKKWSAEMAYTLGYFFADGSMEDASYLRGLYIRVTSIDRETIERFRRLLDSKHTITLCKPTTKNSRMRYLLRIGDREIYRDLFRLGLYPNKSLTMKFPKIPKKYMKDFVRGYFDGDGCVYLWRTKNKNGDLIIRKLSTIFTSGSKDFLIELLKQLQNLIKLDRQKIYNSHRSMQLSFSTSDSIKLFKFMYTKTKPELLLRRKLDVYLNYFDLKKPGIDKTVKNIIQCFH